MCRRLQKRQRNRNALESPETESSAESRNLVEAGLTENRRTVVGDNVDAAELLHEHHDAGGEHGATIPADAEELDNGGLAGRHIRFFLEECVDHEEIASCLQLSVAESAKGVVRFAVASAADEPTGRFGAEKDLSHNEERGQASAANENRISALAYPSKLLDRHSRSEHEAPVQTGDIGGVADVVEGERRYRAEHDAESRPDLPSG